MFARHRRAVTAVALALIGLGACSTGDHAPKPAPRPTSTTVTRPAPIDPAWDSAGAKAAQSLGAKLGADAGDCRGLAAYDRVRFLATFQRLDWPIPLWVGSCVTANGEDLQVEIWKNSATVAQRLRTKATRLCGPHNGGLPGYAYVEGPTFVLQPDTRSGAEALAPRVGGTARWQDCRKTPSAPSSP